MAAAHGPWRRVVFWQRTDAAGAELFRLAQGPDGARLSGTILAAPEGAPLHVDYVIECGPSFETRAVSVAVEGEAGRRTLALQVEKAGVWRRDGHVVPALARCIDVDLGLSPSTNTLPIRRLGLLELPPGTAREVTAAWIGFPDWSSRRCRSATRASTPGASATRGSPRGSPRRSRSTRTGSSSSTRRRGGARPRRAERRRASARPREYAASALALGLQLLGEVVLDPNLLDRGQLLLEPVVVLLRRLEEALEELLGAVVPAFRDSSIPRFRASTTPFSSA